MLDILVPVLGRPHRAAPLVQNIRDTTTVAATVTFVCSLGDNDQIKACNDLYETGAKTFVTNFASGSGDYAKKINHCFAWTAPMEHEWVFMAADDLYFEPGWDTFALKAAGDKYDVIATNDRANAQVKKGLFGTHCLIRRRYVTELGGVADNQPGVVLHEGYDHNFVDRELCHVAQHRGRYAIGRGSYVRHNHPLFDRKVVMDDTYRKALARFRDDQQLFCRRAHLWDFVGLSAPERKLAA